MFESKFEPGKFYHYINGEKANGTCYGKPKLQDEDFIDKKYPMEKEEIREPIKEPDWDGIARGKVRNSVAVAFIGKNGTIILDEDKEQMEKWVDWIMSGK